MKKSLAALMSAASFACMLLTGCFLIDQKTAILWTDIPETASYVEMFNASQSEYRIELVYSDNPANVALLSSGGAPDIVIAEKLSSNSVITAFNPLDKMIENDETFSTSGIYNDLLKLGTRDGIPYVLPVSFNIPAIMFRQGNAAAELEGITISPILLREQALHFNEQSTDKFRVVGFAPSWSPEFLFYNTVLSGGAFAETTDGSLIWNETNLLSSIDFSRKWTEELNSGFQQENDFTLTYCYDPGYKLLNAGRIGFYYTTLRDFFTIPAEDRASLDFKWLGSDSAIPVCEDIVFIGIPKESPKKKTAEAFIKWFFSENTQKDLLESGQFKHTRGFGICNGLSSLRSINELIIPSYYKRLIGTIPPADYLDFPENLPAEWDEIRSDVVIPWLLNQNSDNPGTVPLSENLKTWTLQEKKE